MFKLPSYIIDFDEEYMTELGDKYYKCKNQLKREKEKDIKKDLIDKVQLYENMRVIYQFDKAFFFAIEYVKSMVFNNDNRKKMFDEILSGKKIDIEKLTESEISDLYYIVNHLSKSICEFMKDLREKLNRAERRNKRLEEIYND